MTLALSVVYVSKRGMEAGILLRVGRLGFTSY